MDADKDKEDDLLIAEAGEESFVCESSAEYLASQREIDKITEQILGCAFKVHNYHGHGFHEKVYENSLVHEMQKRGLKVDQQYPFCVYYDGILVGEYKADIIVEEKVLFEAKVAQALVEKHKAQCLNYLKATGLKVCLLVNFGNPRLEYKRIVNNF